MTYEQYKKYEDEYLKFEKVVNKTSQRSDLHAFNLLDKLVPDKFDIISRSDHDIIYLQVKPEKLAEVATEEQVIELIRCGVMYDSNCNRLCMFT